MRWGGNKYPQGNNKYVEIYSKNQNEENFIGRRTDNEI